MTSSGSSYSYNSPSRIKTLDLLAQNKPYQSQSYDNLIRYCFLARGQGCTNFNELKDFFLQRYQWDVLQREEDIHKAWNETTPSAQTNNLGIDSGINSVQTTNNELLDEKRVYFSMKKDAFAKPTLLCQINDPLLQFIGDTGAIGRLSTDSLKQTITVDLKGRQYSGKIRSGPTVMILNMSHPSRSISSTQTVLKIESITNEFCPLEFEKDLLADLMGSYTGEGMDDFRSSLDVEGEEDENAEGGGTGGGGGSGGKKGKDRSETTSTKKKGRKREIKNNEKEPSDQPKTKRARSRKSEKEESDDDESDSRGDKQGKKTSKPKPTPKTSTPRKKAEKPTKIIKKSEDTDEDDDHDHDHGNDENDEDDDDEEEEDEEDEESDSDFSTGGSKKRNPRPLPSSTSTSTTTKKRKSPDGSGIRNPKISTQRVRTKGTKKRKSSSTSKK